MSFIKYFKNAGWSIQRRFRDKFKAFSGFLIASIDPSERWNKNASEILCCTCDRRKQEIAAVLILLTQILLTFRCRFLKERKR